VSVDDLKAFRQVGSITPGHPEVGITPGVEVSTGPLGQVCKNGICCHVFTVILLLKDVCGLGSSRSRI